MWKSEKENGAVKSISVIFLETGLMEKEQDFMALTESSQRVDLVYNSIKKTAQFKSAITGPQDRKSNQISGIARAEGNNYFVRNENNLALECYTRSIAFAENRSSYLAFAYGNRSAVLFDGEYYKECLEDIERALSLEYPEKLKDKLLIRKAKAESLISQTKKIEYHHDLPVITSKNPKISSASDSVKIHYTENYGRHIIATKHIKIGEVISVENAFIHNVFPKPKSNYVHCHQCLKICFNMIPCKNCSTSLYCSEECRSKDFEKYHKYMCLFPIPLPGEMIFVKMALIGLEDSKKLDKGTSEIYRSDSFKELIQLTTNEEKCCYNSLCHHAIASSLAYHALRENPKFSSIYDSYEDDKKLKEFLYKANLIKRFNAFGITKFYYTPCDPPFEMNLTETRIAAALYTFTSLYNHSCVPNCGYFFYGSQIVIRAQDNIKKGEQLTICYGFEFAEIPKHTRQLELKNNYLFDCSCKACTQNWPTFDNIRRGKEFPVQIAFKVTNNDFSDTGSNHKLLEEILSARKMYYDLKKQEPSQNLLMIQNMISELFRFLANKNVDF